MHKIKLQNFTLIGLAMPGQTTNQNGQSAIDCGNHWQRFEKGNYAARIKDKLSDEIFAVYHFTKATIRNLILISLVVKWMRKQKLLKAWIV